MARKAKTAEDEFFGEEIITRQQVVANLIAAIPKMGALTLAQMHSFVGPKTEAVYSDRETDIIDEGLAESDEHDIEFASTDAKALLLDPEREFKIKTLKPITLANALDAIVSGKTYKYPSRVIARMRQLVKAHAAELRASAERAEDDPVTE